MPDSVASPRIGPAGGGGRDVAGRGPERDERLVAVVHGVVQGVFFRYNTRRHAERIGLAGTVENLPDGTVRVVAEGPRDRLEELLAWLRVGPDAAVVERVDAAWSDATGLPGDFRILR